MLIEENVTEITNKYLLTISNYTKYFFNNITSYKNKNLMENLYIKGLIVIQNIFNISLLYLDNIGEIYNLCEKGYVYFIEFINQIYMTVSIDTNFELTIKDAVIFCYKKTILLFENKIEINDNVNKKDILNIINLYNNITNNIYILINNNIYYLIENNYNIQQEDSNILQNINIKLQNNILNINKLQKKLISNLNVSQQSNNNAISNLYNFNQFIKYIVNHFNNYKNGISIDIEQKPRPDQPINYDLIYKNIYNLLKKYI